MGEFTTFSLLAFGFTFRLPLDIFTSLSLTFNMPIYVFYCQSTSTRLEILLNIGPKLYTQNFLFTLKPSVTYLYMLFCCEFSGCQTEKKTPCIANTLSAAVLVAFSSAPSLHLIWYHQASELFCTTH